MESEFVKEKKQESGGFSPAGHFAGFYQRLGGILWQNFPQKPIDLVGILCYDSFTYQKGKF